MAVGVSDLTETNRLSITRQKNGALDECRARGIHGDEKNGLGGQSPSNETSEKPRAERDAITERNAVLISRSIHLDGIIRRALSFGRVPFSRKVEKRGRNARSRELGGRLQKGLAVGAK